MCHFAVFVEDGEVFWETTFGRGGVVEPIVHIEGVCWRGRAVGG